MVNGKHEDGFRYKVFHDGEPIASTALLEDAGHIVERYEFNPMYVGTRIEVRDYYKWDRPTVQTAHGGSRSTSKVIPLHQPRA